MKKPCRPFHRVLLADEFTPMGAHVTCLECHDSFHIAESTLLEVYYHAHHVSGGGIFGRDLDFFLHDSFVEGGKK